MSTRANSSSSPDSNMGRLDTTAPSTRSTNSPFGASPSATKPNNTRTCLESRTSRSAVNTEPVLGILKSGGTQLSGLQKAVGQIGDASVADAFDDRWSANGPRRFWIGVRGICTSQPEGRYGTRQLIGGRDGFNRSSDAAAGEPALDRRVTCKRQHHGLTRTSAVQGVHPSQGNVFCMFKARSTVVGVHRSHRTRSVDHQNGALSRKPEGEQW